MAYNAENRPMAEVDETQKVDRSSVLDEKVGRVEEGQGLHRGLQARHITMIAIGGAIGAYEAGGVAVANGLRHWSHRRNGCNSCKGRVCRCRQKAEVLTSLSPGSLLIAYLFVGIIHIAVPLSSTYEFRFYRVHGHVCAWRNGNVVTSWRRFCRIRFSLCRSW
jgi:amino acid permease